MTPGFGAPDQGEPEECRREVDQCRVRMPPDSDEGGRCRGSSGSDREHCPGVEDARWQGKRRRPRRSSDRSEARFRGIAPASGRNPPARRSGDPEGGLALQFNRFRNPYSAKRKGRKTQLIQ